VSISVAGAKRTLGVPLLSLFLSFVLGRGCFKTGVFILLILLLLLRSLLLLLLLFFSPWTTRSISTVLFVR
jgi:hypothetical protein